MQTAEALRRQIASVEDLQSVIRTMKALAAVSIRQYERAVESLAEYSRVINLGLQVVLRNQADIVASGGEQAGGDLLAVVFGSDQGMCGSFNEQVAAFALGQMDALAVPAERRRILALGARVAARLHDNAPPATTFAMPSSVAGMTPVVQDILLEIDRWRAERPIRQAMLFYNRNPSGAPARPHAHQLLPLDATRLRLLAQEPWPSRVLPTYTIEPEPLFSALIRQYLFVSLSRALAESLASENASRLTAMQAAEKNVGEHLAALTALFHQQRQNTITEELLDIVSGFEVLTSGAGG